MILGGFVFYVSGRLCLICFRRFCFTFQAALFYVSGGFVLRSTAEQLARRDRLRLVPPERCQQVLAQPAVDVVQHTRVPGVPYPGTMIGVP